MCGGLAVDATVIRKFGEVPKDLSAV